MMHASGCHEEIHWFWWSLVLQITGWIARLEASLLGEPDCLDRNGSRLGNLTKPVCEEHGCQVVHKCFGEPPPFYVSFDPNSSFFLPLAP